MTQNSNRSALNSAISLLAKKNGTISDGKPVTAVPTSGARASLDFLMLTPVDVLMQDSMNIRQISENLFNWSDTPKSSRIVIRALGDALRTPGKHAQTVELCAYLSALAPLLEPDRIASLFTVINEVNTAYAPARYTLQLSAVLSKLLSRYPEERRVKIARSLWVQSHQGRWWDMTSGMEQLNAIAERAALAQEALDAHDDSWQNLFYSKKLPWTPQNAQLVSTLPVNDERTMQILDEYNIALSKGEVADPDTALLSSHIEWLPSHLRPESPVGSLITTLLEITEAIEYELPQKPKSFAEMFPSIRLYGSAVFPFPSAVLNTDGVRLGSYTMQLITTAALLADNRTYMGNCTWGYKNRMERSDSALYRIVDEQGTVYNAAMDVGANNRWRAGEINSRYNRGNVPAGLRTRFQEFVNALPPRQNDNETLQAMELNKKLEGINNKKYLFRV